MKKFLSESVTTIATCWQIKLKCGKILGFTDIDHCIEMHNIKYLPNSAFTKSEILYASHAGADSLEIEGVLDNESITHEDLLNGIFDHAQVIIYLVNYLQPQTDYKILHTGYIGEVTIKNGSFFAEIKGLKQAFNQTIGELYSPQCRASLGDNRCKVKLTPHETYIKRKINEEEFYVSNLNLENGYFKYGTVVITNGKNAGHKREIFNQEADKITLFEVFRYPIKVRDKLLLYAGCNREFSTCVNKFNNAINFRGEPFIKSGTNYLGS